MPDDGLTPAAAGGFTVESVALTLPVTVSSLPRFDAPLTAGVRAARLLTEPPWVRSLGKLTLTVSTEGWKFPVRVTSSISWSGKARAWPDAADACDSTHSPAPVPPSPVEPGRGCSVHSTNRSGW